MISDFVYCCWKKLSMFASRFGSDPHSGFRRVTGGRLSSSWKRSRRRTKRPLATTIRHRKPVQLRNPAAASYFSNFITFFSRVVHVLAHARCAYTEEGKHDDGAQVVPTVR